MAEKLSIEKGTDGSAFLIGTLDGARLVFAHVNASQVDEARVAQGLGSYPPEALAGTASATSDAASDADETSAEG